MIWDCFLYSGEEHLLEIAKAELCELDIIHVIVHSPYTFTGKLKDKSSIPLHLADRCIIIYVEDMPNNGNAWDNERFQRNAIMRGIGGAQDGDFVIIRDADEVPRAEAIKKYHPAMEVAALTQNKYGYWLNCMEGYQDWEIAKITTYEILKKSTPDLIRNSGQQSWIAQAGWHWSWLGDQKTLLNKMASFSHTECNTPELRAKIGHKINTGQSLWGDDYWPIVPIDNTFPKYVVEHQYDTLKHLIKQ